MADIILASWFYVNESEKTKLNWLCYEYSLNLYDGIKKSRKLNGWAAEIGGDIQVANFSAYFAKRLKKSVEDSQAGITGCVVFDDQYINDYFHTIIGRESVAIMKAAMSAWERLMLVCGSCPTRCISERHERCEIFDRMERGGYFSY